MTTTDAAKTMDDLIRKAAGRTPPEPDPAADGPNGKGDGGATSPQDGDRRSGCRTEDDLIRRAFRRRQD